MYLSNFRVYKNSLVLIKSKSLCIIFLYNFKRQLEDNKKLLEENSETGPKLRSEFCDVHGQGDSFPEMGLYSVGMVMKHKRYHYVCVIYGWDAVCTQSKVISIYDFRCKLRSNWPDPHALS